MPRWLLTALLLSGCSVSHGVKPIGAGNTALEASLGGPVAVIAGATLPIPLSTVGVRHGVNDTTDVAAHLHTTALAFGIVGVDVGLTRQLLAQQGARPRVMSSGLLLLGAGPGALRLWGQGQLISAWDWGTREHTTYGGVDLLFQPHRLLASDEVAARSAKPRRVVPGLLVGQRIQLTDHFGLAAELTWFSPWEDVEELLAIYPAPGTQGALQVQLGFTKTFGQRGDP